MKHPILNLCRNAFRAALLVIMVAGTASASDTAAAGADGPVDIVRETAGKILQKLDANRDSYTQHPDELRKMVRQDLLPLIDLRYSARLILGKAGRGISEEQLDAFADAMSSVLINRYADGLLEFRSTDQLEVLPMKGRNSDKLTRVRTRVKLDNGGTAPVDYAFHKTPDGWKAFDVTVEGISYVITFRNQIVPRVEADGIEQVTADIRAGNVPLNEDQQ